MPKPLSIGIDVRYLRTAKTGTKTYLDELIKEFKKMETEQLRFHYFDTAIPVYSGNNKLLKLAEHVRYQLWKQLFLPLKAFVRKCDIVFCADDCVPILHLGYKTIPVFHDAFCFEIPENYGKLWLWLYMKTAIPAAKKSTYVITPSEYSKEQINHYTDITNEQLKVIYEGPKTLTTPDAIADKDVLDTLSLKPQKYLLHVGSMFKRKNIPALIEAFAIVKKSGYGDLKLALAGPTPSIVENDYDLIKDAIAKNDLQSDVVITGYLNDLQLSSIYKNAIAYIFPSTNEGFGLPILEAFNNNLPVLVANNTCLPEIGGDAVLQFDPYSIQDIASKIKQVLDDVDLRKAMIIKGTNRLTNFSWNKAAKELIEIFGKAANYS